MQLVSSPLNYLFIIYEICFLIDKTIIRVL